MTETEPAAEFALHDVAQERGGVRVLNGVSAEFPAHEVTALVGPSGAGKTSLLRLLDRLDDPVSGTVCFHGRPIDAYPVRELRRRVAFVFQTPAMFAGTVADNLAVAMGLRAARARAVTPPPAAASGEIAELLRTVELDPALAGRQADRLSGGEKQRVALARALATGPEALLLDEPTAALDPEVAMRLMATVARLNERTGLTIVMVTHRLAEAREASSYTAVLEGGRVVEAGPTARLFSSASTARARAYLASAGERAS